ncbi:hypothetical protein CDAR_282061 [Caerostris darwini]|uniref:Uncharacterized protein n=1 Tax=Caerostris darwini TaxID=1538125 RepID=A0AAV4WQ29_9ARAC|nr:hypothetical protein CDAR_282061 [Caerostris darwini]
MRRDIELEGAPAVRGCGRNGFHGHRYFMPSNYNISDEDFYFRNRHVSVNVGWVYTEHRPRGCVTLDNETPTSYYSIAKINKQN